MEVLDNANHIKETNNPASGNNFPCRLSRDLNVANSVPQNKSEGDVRLLLACKTQLSSEVIKWKMESLRFQKERDAARVRVKELDSLISKYSEKIKDLESHLLAVEEENKKLRIKNLNSDYLGIQKLSLNLEKYHSYPWLESNPKVLNCTPSTSSIVSKKSHEILHEDWKEVSQKLLEKMKQEMKELQELSSQFSCSEKRDYITDVNDTKTLEVPGYLEESLSNLTAETQSLKHSLLEQRKNLQSIICMLNKGHTHSSEEMSRSSSKSFNFVEGNPEKPEENEKLKAPMSHSYPHSDDSFQAFFIKHLDHQNQIANKSTKKLHLQPDAGNSQLSRQSPSAVTSPKALKLDSHACKENFHKTEERVCPICQMPFDADVPQKDFEEHVLKHLEVESASLLDQYVIL